MDINQVKSDYDNEVLISRKTLGEVIARCLELERAVASLPDDETVLRAALQDAIDNRAALTSNNKQGA